MERSLVHRQRSLLGDLPQRRVGVAGSGEVYQAHDELLDRDVAIKVLQEAVAQNVERLARFEREARLLTSLNHPNLATRLRSVVLKLCF